MDKPEYQKMYELEDNYWWFVGRRKILTGLLDKMNLGNHSRILDIGCGTGINFSYLQRYGKVTGLDMSQYAISYCWKRGFTDVVQGHAEELNFENSSFDLITALDILEHVDDNKALAQCHRVLKPNGYLLLNVPAFDFLWSKHDEAIGHKRRYTRSMLINTLESNGFVVERVSFWNFFLFPPVAVVRLVKKLLKRRRKSDIEKLPNIVNWFLTMTLSIEVWLLSFMNLPVGISLLCVAKAVK